MLKDIKPLINEISSEDIPSYFKKIEVEANQIHLLVEKISKLQAKLVKSKYALKSIQKFKTFYDEYSSKLASLTQEDYDQCKKWLNLSCTPISDIKVPSIPSKQEIPMTYAIMELNNVKILKV